MAVISPAKQIRIRGLRHEIGFSAGEMDDGGNSTDPARRQGSCSQTHDKSD
jgi:hypothetical protein